MAVKFKDILDAGAWFPVFYNTGHRYTLALGYLLILFTGIESPKRCLCLVNIAMFEEYQKL